jgi:hypothetical protein
MSVLCRFDVWLITMICLDVPLVHTVQGALSLVQSAAARLGGANYEFFLPSEPEYVFSIPAMKIIYA